VTFVTIGRRFLQRAALARDLSLDAVRARNITQALSAASVMLSPALTVQLVAQAILYIISCVAMVFSCLYAVVRLRKLSSGLLESQKFVQRHAESMSKERNPGKHTELPRINASVREPAGGAAPPRVFCFAQRCNAIQAWFQGISSMTRTPHFRP
jgi:hypothetical protein